MPGLTYNECIDWSKVGHGSYEDWHHDNCFASWHPGDGWWRAFWTSIHCRCECHYRDLEEAKTLHQKELL